MRVGINALPIYGYGGLTYLKNLLPVLDARQDEHRWYVYGRRVTLDQIRFPARKIVFRQVASSGGLLGRVLREQLWLPWLFERDRIDVVYTANNVDLFLARQPTVIAIRNVEPFLHTAYFNSFPQRLRCRLLGWLSGWSLRTSDGIVCVSRFAARVAASRASGATEKMVVVYHGCKRPAWPPARPARAPLRYLFSSARMAGYANLLTLVEAYGYCRRLGVVEPLFIAGGDHDQGYRRRVEERMRQLELEGSVHLLGYLSHDEFLQWVAHCQVFIFPSLLEACPNTLLEAMASGCAIVASDTEPARELAREAVCWCDGTSPESMASAILRVLRDPAYAAGLAWKALQQSRQFHWASTAEQLVRVLERVHQGRVGVPEAPVPVAPGTVNPSPWP